MASRPGGGAGWSGLVVGALVVLFILLMAAQVGLGRSMGAQAQRWLAIVAVAVGVFLFIALFYVITGRGRRVIAQRRPGAAIARVNRTDEGRDAFRAYFGSIGMPRYKTGMTFWLVADPGGLAVWNTTNPELSVTIPWADVVSLEAAEVNMTARVSNGVVLRLRAGDRDLSVPIGFIGSGFGGMYPPPMSEVHEFIDQASRFLPADSAPDAAR